MRIIYFLIGAVLVLIGIFMIFEMVATFARTSPPMEVLLIRAGEGVVGILLLIAGHRVSSMGKKKAKTVT